MLVLLSAPASAGEVTLGGNDTGTFAAKVLSYSEIPFRTVIRQKYDYSCGSAALATLLRFSYAQDTDEAKVFKEMWAVGDQPKIQKQGFSLLDMKTYLETRGYQADGYRVTLADLQRLKTPAIALIQLGTYRHFVVIKGVNGGHVLVGDPAQGLKLYRGEEFQKMWNGIAFMLHGPKAEGGEFNDAKEWARWTEAHPLSAAVLSRPLEPFTRDMRITYQVRPNFDIPPVVNQP